MSIGWVMFWKAFAVTVWAALAESWYAYRKRKAAQGVPLHLNKNGVYVPRDWTAKAEAIVRGTGRFLMVLAYINVAVLICIWAYLKLA